MKIKIKKINYFFLLLYLIAISAYQLGTGFDAIFVRVTFALLVFGTFLSTKNIKITNILKWSIIFWSFYFLSIIWAYDMSDTFSYLTQTIQIIGLAVCLPVLIEDKKDMDTFLNLLLISLLYSSILLIIRTPISAWGTERIGDAIGVYSNGLGTRLSICAIISLYMLFNQFKLDKKNIYKIIFYIICLVLFVILNFFTGSRKSLFFCVFGIVSYELLSTKGIKFFLKIIVIVLLIYIFIYLIYNIPEIYTVIGKRLDLFIQSVFMGSEIKDGSLEERLYYIDTAKKLFFSKPIIGVGGNNFVTYLKKIGYGHATYCHNNFYEMLSTLGIIGFILYYSLWFNSLFYLLKKYIISRDTTTLLFLIIIILSILGDYFTVSYCVDFNQLIFIFINVYINIVEAEKAKKLAV